MPARAVPALGIIQILTWGSTFYLLAVLADPIVQDTGWPRAAVTGGVSLALLTSGLTAGLVGRRISDHGGRDVMAMGICLLIAGLLGLAMAPSLTVYFAAWLVLGCGMSASLYEAAFSTLGRLFGASARGAITTLTLWGGFASTICWPLSAILVEEFGWRGACAAYAALHLCLTLPLCRYGLPPANAPRPSPPDTAPVRHEAVRRADPRFWFLALAGVCLSFAFSVISIHLITLLTSIGLALPVAIGLGSLIGPAQVGARMLEMLGGQRHSPLLTLLVSTACVASGIAGLLWGWPAALCLLIYGAGTGLWSIARGTVPLALFGADIYPVIMARLALPILVAAALAPIVGAALIDGVGAADTLRVLAVIAAVPCLAAGFLWRLRRASHTSVH